MSALNAESLAALPMYDFPELGAAHDAWWAALSRLLLDAGLTRAPRKLTRSLGHVDLWRHPALLLGQGCEYPLAKSFGDSIRLVATPRYGAPGCEGAAYRSAIVVRDDDPAETLSDLRGRRCVINEPDSNSGMNLLRAAIARLAQGTRFFESVQFSGAHRRSAAMVAAGQADVAAIDCVSFAHFKRLYPSSVASLRILDWTPSSPSLPLITAGGTDDGTLQLLRASLAAVFADRTLDSVRQCLLLDGIDLQPALGFPEVLRLERQAVEQGYPVIH